MGKFDAVNAVEKTTVHPWFIDYEASKITPAGASLNKGGTVTCVSYRNYITTWSDFNLEGNT